MFKTRVTKLLGIEYPILGGAMMWLSDAVLAAAVSNAGGLGTSRAGALSLATSVPTASGFGTGLSKVIGLWDNSVVAQPEPRRSADNNRYQGKRLLIIFMVAIP